MVLEFSFVLIVVNVDIEGDIMVFGVFDEDEGFSILDELVLVILVSCIFVLFYLFLSFDFL